MQFLFTCIRKTSTIEKINNKNVKEESILVKAGRKFNDYKVLLNPPVYHSSTILFPTYKDYLNAANGESIYDVINDVLQGIIATVMLVLLLFIIFQMHLLKLKGVDKRLFILPDYLHLLLLFLTFTKAGSHVLIQDNSYYRLKRFAENELPKRGIEVTFYDPTQDITDLIQSNTSLIMIETPGSVAFEISNVEHIVKVAKERGIVTVCDNSWATPLLFKPLDYGIDVALYAVTKYLAGHSDLLMGLLLLKVKFLNCFMRAIKLWSNHSIARLLPCTQGLRTLHTRMKRHQNTAMEVAKWLEKHSKIKKVLYPALPSHPQHELWKSYFKRASGTFSIALDREYSCEELSCMVDHMKVFSIGASWEVR
ncbi:putative cystathionine beta-lyase [Trichonephila clavata]|uniref:Putative cystathionine beta-lyase n=1 Tax=Trichonephila clavata TaxID=2740835 RepID=A0A8X6LKK9_TRICU|nr:putative cystathionine beta-lyase [Trichonephila clavata]